MACTITVPFWPTAYDNLQWSKDNQIAVVGGDQILILTPRLKEQSPSKLWWDTETLIRINAFTVTECPRANVLTDHNMSIGEELSTFQAEAAAWSPSGLTKYGSSVLAVLTSNHVLSIWSPEAESKETPSWKRTVVINHAVRDFYQYAAEQASDHDLDENEREERLQIQQRIRCFAWVQPVYNEVEIRHPDLFSGEQYLVVSTEGGHLLLVQLSSPHTDRLTKEMAWKATVVGNMPLTLATHLGSTDAANIQRTSTVFPRTSATEFIAATAIAVGGWQSSTSDDRHVASLSFILEGKLFTTALKHDSLRSASFGPPESVQRHLDQRADLRGPLKTFPEAGTGSLVFFGDDAIFHAELHFENSEHIIGINLQEHDLDDRWDDPTGAAMSTHLDGNVRVHVVSHLSSLTALTHVLKTPLDSTDSVAEESAWHVALANSKAAYGASYYLGDHVQERTWGITCAPMGGYMATCASMHPNDVVAYVINAEQTSALNITRESKMSANAFEPNQAIHGLVSGLPTSTVLFFLKRHLEQRGGDQLQRGSDDNLVRTIELLLSPQLTSPRADGMQSSTSLDILLSQTRIQLLAGREVRRAHARRICNIVGECTALRPECTVTVVRQVAEVLFSLTHDLLDANSLSMSIRRLYDIATSKLDTNYNVGDTEPSAKGWDEQCKMCQRPIAFESFKWARCQYGHQFSRCALSLLAIQEPGTTKHCSVCDLQYLDEKIVADFQPDGQELEMVDVAGGEASSTNQAIDEWVKISQSGGTTARSKTTIAELLFAACDVCVYCGGKFED